MQINHATPANGARWLASTLQMPPATRGPEHGCCAKPWWHQSGGFLAEDLEGDALEALSLA